MYALGGGGVQVQRYAYGEMRFTCSRLQLPGPSTLNTECRIKMCYQQITLGNHRISEAKDMQ